MYQSIVKKNSNEIGCIFFISDKKVKLASIKLGFCIFLSSQQSANNFTYYSQYL
jgi:hypothetical protein